MVHDAMFCIAWLQVALKNTCDFAIGWLNLLRDIHILFQESVLYCVQNILSVKNENWKQRKKQNKRQTWETYYHREKLKLRENLKFTKEASTGVRGIKANNQRKRRKRGTRENDNCDNNSSNMRTKKKAPWFSYLFPLLLLAWLKTPALVLFLFTFFLLVRRAFLSFPPPSPCRFPCLALSVLFPLSYNRSLSAHCLSPPVFFDTWFPNTFHRYVLAGKLFPLV